MRNALELLLAAMQGQSDSLQNFDKDYVPEREMRPRIEVLKREKEPSSKKRLEDTLGLTTASEALKKYHPAYKAGKFAGKVVDSAKDGRLMDDVVNTVKEHHPIYQAGKAALDGVADWVKAPPSEALFTNPLAKTGNLIREMEETDWTRELNERKKDVDAGLELGKYHYDRIQKPVREWLMGPDSPETATFGTGEVTWGDQPPAPPVPQAAEPIALPPVHEPQLTQPPAPPDVSDPAPEEFTPAPQVEAPGQVAPPASGEETPDRLQRLIDMVTGLMGAQKDSSFTDLSRGLLESTKGNLFGGQAPDYNKIFPASSGSSDPLRQFTSLLSTVATIDNQTQLRNEANRRFAGQDADRQMRSAKFNFDVTKEALKEMPEALHRIVQGRAILGPQLRRMKDVVPNDKVLAEVTGPLNQFLGSGLPTGWSIEQLVAGGVSATKQVFSELGVNKNQMSDEAWGLLSDILASSSRYIFDISGKATNMDEVQRHFRTYFNRQNPAAFRQGFQRFEEDMNSFYNGHLFADRAGAMQKFAASLKDQDARMHAQQMVGLMPKVERGPLAGEGYKAPPSQPSTNPRAQPAPVSVSTPIEGSQDPLFKRTEEVWKDAPPGTRVFFPQGDQSRVIIRYPDGTEKEIR